MTEDTQRTLPVPLFLMGMKHSGKSTIGKLLARRYGLTFHDLDELVLFEERRSQSPGTRLSSVREIYRQRGRERFMQLEALAATSLARIARSDSCTIGALGGGTIENLPAMQALEGTGTFVLLDTDPDVLFKRISAGGIPPFLSPDKPRESFLELYHKRIVLYRARADVSVALAEENPTAVLTVLIRSLKEYDHVRK